MKAKSLLSLVLAAGTIATPSVAQASGYDYVCTVHLSPKSTGAYGDSGFVQARYYSGPNCTGSYQGQINYCSENAFANSCTSNTYYQYSEQHIMNLYQSLVVAMTNGLRLYHVESTCNDGDSDCGVWFRIHGS